MIEILSNFFRSVFVLSPNDLLCSVYLCLNQLAPAYVGKSNFNCVECSICITEAKLLFLSVTGLELGVGEGIIIKAIAQATGRATDKVKADVVSKGDVGLVAEASKSMQKTLTLFR